MSDQPDITSLISRYLDNDLDADALRTLEQWINESERNALMFSRLCYNNHEIRHCFVSRDLADYVDRSRASSDESGRFLFELMQIEARLQASTIDATELIEARSRVEPADRLPAIRPHATRCPGPRVIVIPQWLVYAAAAVVLMSVVGVFYSIRDRGPGVAETAPEEDPVVEQAVSRVAVLYKVDPESGFAGALDRDLFPGDKVQAGQDGAVMILDTGVVVRLQPHARLAVRGNNRCGLASGRLSAAVPRSAIGFEVEVPGGLVRDLGTEFTVAIDPVGVSEVRVLTGEVTMHKRSAEGVVSGGYRLVQGQAGVIDPIRKQVALVREVRLDLRSTGIGSAPGLTDLNWEVVRVSGDPSFEPKPALVVAGEYGRRAVSWDPNTAQSAWVIQPGLAEDLAPQQQLTTFRHRFEVPRGADTDAIVIPSVIWADDNLASITVNGQELIDADHPGTSGTRFSEPLRFSFNRGFKTGENIIEITVRNDDEVSKTSSPSGLRVEFEPVHIEAPVPVELDNGGR